MSKALGILREDMAAGFALTGLDVTRVKDAAQAREVLQKAVESREYGLLIVDEGLFAELDARTRESYDKLSVPLVVPVPGTLRWERPGTEAGDDEIAALIRRAVGYQLNIQL